MVWLKNNEKQINFVFCDCIANSQRLNHELKTTEDKLRNELRGKILFNLNINGFNIIKWNGLATSSKLETTATNLASARSELSTTKSTIADLTAKLNGYYIVLFIFFKYK
jgi:hypothetical protein